MVAVRRSTIEVLDAFAQKKLAKLGSVIVDCAVRMSYDVVLAVPLSTMRSIENQSKG